MQYRQLRYFVKIVEAGSFSRAASTIHVAQPALSQQVAELEEEMGIKLLHRTPRGVQSTPAGEILFEKASSILRRLDELPGLLKSSAGNITGTVSVGIVASLAEILIGPIVEHIKSAFPNVMLKCMDGDSETLSARVLAHKLDLAVIFEHEFVPAFLRLPIFIQRLYLVGKPLPGKARSSISIKDIGSLPLVLPGDNIERRRLIDGAFAALNIAPNVIAEADNLSSELAAVRTGIGHTILNIGEFPKAGFETFAKPLVIEPPITMTCSIISSGDSTLTNAGNAARSSIASIISSFIQDGKRPGASLIKH
ncbi:LysR family transcriptional regulator [Afipia sp. DC4300-2b1]|uniref:LysR family transcriptional regulator n=1 Tax=Afipia sp. DC4300-2b1 TaxID=2804672 RepID=UPI003CE814D7